MNQFYKFFIFLSGLIASNLIFAQNNNVTLDKILAIVNNDVITQSEFKKKSIQVQQQFKQQGVALPNKKIFKHDLLQNIIEEKLQMQLVNKMKITITPKEIDQSIKQITQSNKITLPQLKAQLEKSNMTFNLFKNNIKQQLLIQRLQQSQLQSAWKVSKQDIKARMQQLIAKDKIHNTQYHLEHLLLVLPEKMTAQDKKNWTHEADNISRILKKNPEQFSSYAKQHNKSKFILQNADLGLRRLNELPNLFKTITPSLKLNEIKTNIEDKNGFHFIKLIQKNYSSPDQNTLKKVAMQQLSMQQAQSELKHWLIALKENSYIKLVAKP